MRSTRFGKSTAAVNHAKSHVVAFGAYTYMCGSESESELTSSCQPFRNPSRSPEYLSTGHTAHDQARKPSRSRSLRPSLWIARYLCPMFLHFRMGTRSRWAGDWQSVNERIRLATFSYSCFFEDHHTVYISSIQPINIWWLQNLYL